MVVPVPQPHPVRLSHPRYRLPRLTRPGRAHPFCCRRVLHVYVRAGGHPTGSVHAYPSCIRPDHPPQLGRLHTHSDPHHMRFVVVSVVSLLWNTYLSAGNARQAKLEQEEKEHEKGLDSRIDIKLSARNVSIPSITCCTFNDRKGFCLHSK
ncbi:hypothetical protein ARMSODRAFT_736959 [Armillaria solidipes]|uniref:Uncharacterized protein n=1 Tax=Armillaria solidipes TaxID=1076256 RepID=A0A2H3B8M6_9AGAR|nr:hypothetical protein ARMSODRAFT_736959 [Armillaria solidipes]